MATIIASPAAEPVTLESARRWLRSSSDDDDTVIELLAAARAQIEGETGRATTARSVTQTATGWGDLWLAQVPVTGLQVRYTDAAGAVQLLDPAEWRELGGRVYLMADWPGLSPDVAEPVTLTYTAGHASADDVPPEVRLAIRSLLASYYEARSSSVDMPAQVQRIVLAQRRSLD